MLTLYIGASPHAIEGSQVDYPGADNVQEARFLCDSLPRDHRDALLRHGHVALQKTVVHVLRCLADIC